MNVQLLLIIVLPESLAFRKVKMSLQKKMIIVLLLIALTMVSIELLSGVTITIKGKGRGVTVYNPATGDSTFRCDYSSDNDCTLSVNYPTP